MQKIEHSRVMTEEWKGKKEEAVRNEHNRGWIGEKKSKSVLLDWIWRRARQRHSRALSHRQRRTVAKGRAQAGKGVRRCTCAKAGRGGAGALRPGAEHEEEP
jgi:hypothetical protein